MTDTHDLTDDQLAALTASIAWSEREYAYTGSAHSPEEFAALVAVPGAENVEPMPDLLERVLTVVDRYAVDGLVTFKQDTYDREHDYPPEYAFVVKDAPERAALAFDYAPDEARRIYDFIESREPAFVPESLEARING